MFKIHKNMLFTEQFQFVKNNLRTYPHIFRSKRLTAAKPSLYALPAVFLYYYYCNLLKWKCNFVFYQKQLIIYGYTVVHRNVVVGAKAYLDTFFGGEGAGLRYFSKQNLPNLNLLITKNRSFISGRDLKYFSKIWGGAETLSSPS